MTDQTKPIDDIGIFGLFAAIDNFAAENADVIVKGNNPDVENFGVMTATSAVVDRSNPIIAHFDAIPLEDNQLGPDPIVSERARCTGVDYATAEMELALDDAMSNYIHTGRMLSR